MMTRNDFELLARNLAAMRPAPESEGVIGYPDDHCAGYDTAINQVAGACRSSNARFDIGKFKRACGIECSAAPAKMPAKGKPISW